MRKPDDTIRVVIPLTIRKRNGRPKILPPENVYEQEARAQDPHILKALGRAWAWRRRLESGEAASVGDIARTESVTDRFASRMIRLTYMSPNLLEALVILRHPLSLSLNDLIYLSQLPFLEQVRRVVEKPVKLKII